MFVLRAVNDTCGSDMILKTNDIVSNKDTSLYALSPNLTSKLDLKFDDGLPLSGYIIGDAINPAENNCHNGIYNKRPLFDPSKLLAEIARINKLIDDAKSEAETSKKKYNEAKDLLDKLDRTTEINSIEKMIADEKQKISDAGTQLDILYKENKSDVHRANRDMVWIAWYTKEKDKYMGIVQKAVYAQDILERRGYDVKQVMKQKIAAYEKAIQDAYNIMTQANVKIQEYQVQIPPLEQKLKEGYATNGTSNPFEKYISDTTQYKSTAFKSLCIVAYLRQNKQRTYSGD